MTLQEAFQAGAEQMQVHIVAYLITKGHTDLAPKILALPIPLKLVEKETQELSNDRA